MNKDAILRTAPSFSLSGPTIKPGVSVRDTSGSLNALQMLRNWAAFSADTESMAPPICWQSFAIKATGRPSSRIKPVIMLRP